MKTRMSASRAECQLAVRWPGRVVGRRASDAGNTYATRRQPDWPGIKSRRSESAAVAARLGAVVAARRGADRGRPPSQRS